MRAVVQRVRYARVTVEEEAVGAVEEGFCVLLGVTHEDTSEDCRWLGEKIAGLRVFSDDQGKMNRSLMDVEGSILVISQFTLYGDCRKGRRPSFVQAAPPEKAEKLYEEFVTYLKNLGISVETGSFGAEMEVSLCNNGPVTLIIETSGGCGI
ncbi:MAG TPA: D-aminoacyl-tRNA deacylase [Synergistaceae bacterium]|nr:D-aminoacyl-tRNA deacylase [Synergistaceae bacterium]HPJ24734.1 D-aminoacyl-tRNA deacylase [Synergistaceae bacterium]HPQ37075.1 D-aminoacyl-tRNA deacylase [Synergistaceae bacterium]